MTDDSGTTMPMAVSEGEVVAWAEDGRFLVAGEQSAVDRFVAELEPRRHMRLTDLKPVADGLGVLSSVLGMRSAAGSVVQVDPKKWALLRERGVPDASGAFLPSLRDAQGRIVHNLRLRPINGLRTAQLQTALTYAALRLAVQEVTDAVEEIASDVDDLKRMAEAADIGDLAGLYRVLSNARAGADVAGTINQTSWDAVAPHEITAQQAADRLRVLLHRRIADLPLDEDAGTRLDAAQRLLSEEFFARNLRLLVLAEQCRLLWRSLKLDQVRRAEPDAAVGEAASAKALMEENAAADQRLIAELHGAVTRLGKLGPLDGFRVFTRGELPAAAKALHAQVEDFAGTRRAQIDSWMPDPSPTFGDAWSELGLRVEATAIEVRQSVGNWLVDLGASLAKDPEPRVKETVDVPAALPVPSDDDPRTTPLTLPGERGN